MNEEQEKKWNAAMEVYKNLLDQYYIELHEFYYPPESSTEGTTNPPPPPPPPPPPGE